VPKAATVAVTREVRIKASPETIFEFFTDPQKMMRWKGVEAELEPAPGGRYRVNVSGKDVVVGEYVEVDPPRRVVFTWGWEGDPNLPPGTSTVEITLTREGDETLVTLTHRDLPEGALAGQTQGWEHFLPRLAQAAEGRDPGADPWAQTEGGGS
jgi:uncharacterized protein YndB with AHSA1/START domain